MYLSRSYGPDRRIEIHRLLTNEIRLFKSRNDFASHLEDVFDARCYGRSATDQLTGEEIEIPNKSEKFLRSFLKHSKDKALQTTENESWQFLDALWSAYAETEEGFTNGSILDYFDLPPENGGSSAPGSHLTNLPTGQSFALMDEDRGAVAGVFTFREIFRPGTIMGTVWTRKNQEEKADGILIPSGVYREPSFRDHYHWQAVGCYVDSEGLPDEMNRELTSGLHLLLREYETFMPGAMLLSVSSEKQKDNGQVTLQTPLASFVFGLMPVEIDKRR